MQPIPQNGKGLAYAEVVLRARLQAGAATEAFYLNKWTALEDAARILEQTARMLVKTTDVPARQKDRLNAHADELAKEAMDLQQSASAQDEKRSNDALQRIHLKVRELRPEG
ncbi:hypothetical protein AYO44_18220 [Planctomycetaceae bacterium SCGC AG-212-F19]|nr:hypothetical protein AYO44_18220 [Planctomycetaceae bacterium SCGC AG-212-F19]